MEWVPIAGSDGYCVSNDGRVLAPGGRLLSLTPRRSGYVRVGVVYGGVRKIVQVHRLVADSFLGPPPAGATQVNHIDRDPTNNRVANLEWTTPKQNNNRRGAPKRPGGPSRTVVQETLAGEVVQVWDSIAAAARGVGGSRVSIGNACRGINKTSAGYVWRFLDLCSVPGEEWVAIHIYGEDFEVSDMGNVRTKMGVVTRGAVNNNGYMVYRDRPVHRLVAQAFCAPPGPDDTIVNHKDGNPLNNKAENLEWVSHSGNCVHAWISGLHPGANEKLQRRVTRIGEDGSRVEYPSVGEAASACGLHSSTVSKALTGVASTAGGYQWVYTEKRYMTDAELDEVFEELGI